MHHARARVAPRPARFAMLLAAVSVALVWAATAFGQTPPTPDDLVNGLKRGIRLIPPSSGQAPGNQSTAKPAGTQSSGNRSSGGQQSAAPSVDLNVQFATGSAQLTPQATQVLDNLGRALTDAQLAGDRFRIAGHTDTVGSADLNKSLSEQRAQAVAAYLEQKFSIPAGRLETVGMGMDGLVIPTGPGVPEPRNRRVQVINITS